MRTELKCVKMENNVSSVFAHGSRCSGCTVRWWEVRVDDPHAGSWSPKVGGGEVVGQNGPVSSIRQQTFCSTNIFVKTVGVQSLGCGM